MGIAVKQLSKYIVKPVLDDLSQISFKLGEGHNILLGIAGAESFFGKYLHQLNGPAKGIWKIEPRTHDAIWEYLLRYDDPNKTGNIRKKIAEYLSIQHYKSNTNSQYIHVGLIPSINSFREEKLYKNYHERLIFDLYYCCAMARIKLYMIPELLPLDYDVNSMAYYWKRYYNTMKGKGKRKDFISIYYNYIETPKEYKKRNKYIIKYEDKENEYE